MLRGNAKQAIFHGDEEYRYFEDILAEGLEQYSLTLHAYCWMKNHVHMALQVEDKTAFEADAKSLSALYALVQ